MLNNRPLKVIATITYLLLILIAAYFKYFPTIINSEITNILILLLVFALTSLLVYGSFIIQKSTDVYFLLPQSLIFTFIARAIPNLRLSYPPLHDPYYLFVSTLNIIEYGTLEPILGWWYSGVDVQLHWPIMQLLTTTLAHITNVNVMQIFRFFQPTMGMIFFLAIYFLAKTVTKSEGVALLAGLFASINDIIIFYQAEYHPQGLSMIYFVLLVYVFIKSRQISDIRYRYLTIIFSIVFILSHYFTPLFLALIFCLYLIILLIIPLLSVHSVIKDKIYKTVKGTDSDKNLFMIVIVSSLGYHFLVYPSVVQMFLSMTSEFLISSPLVSFGQSNIPFITSVLSSFKWVLFVLALISILFIIKTKKTDEFRLAILFSCIVFAGIIGNYVIMLPTDRLIGFYIPFAVVFGSLTLHRFMSCWFRDMKKNRKIMIVILVSTIIILAGFFNSHTPAYYFQDSDENVYYWYSNILPSMDQYKAVAEWVNKYTSYVPYITKYGVEFDNRVTLFYFGTISYNDVIFRYYHFPDYSNDYVVINPKIPYEDEHGNKISNKLNLYENLNIIYTNSEVIIYSKK